VTGFTITVSCLWNKNKITSIVNTSQHKKIFKILVKIVKFEKNVQILLEKLSVDSYIINEKIIVCIKQADFKLNVFLDR
jgi:hypothetical protein